MRDASFTQGRWDIEQNGREEESEAQCRQGQQCRSVRRPLRQLIPSSSPCPCARGRKSTHTNASSQRLRGRRHYAAAARRTSTTTATSTTSADDGRAKLRRRSRCRYSPRPPPWLVPAVTAGSTTGAVDDTDTSTTVDDTATSTTDAARRRLYAPPFPVSPPTPPRATSPQQRGKDRDLGTVARGGGQKGGRHDAR